MAHELLLLSNSNVHGMKFLEHAQEAIEEFFQNEKTVYFAPYAKADHDAYTAKAQEALKPFGITVIGLHTQKNPARVIETRATSLFVGGGNSFRLLKQLQDLNLLKVVCDKVEAGSLRYMGSSAGTNMSCPTIRTTNDMPIVEPASFQSFGLLPFQINPHYVDPDPNSTFMGETREERLLQFLEENEVPIVGMREGCWLRRSGAQLYLNGHTDARVFQRNKPAQEFSAGADLSWLLEIPTHFDTVRKPMFVGAEPG